MPSEFELIARHFKRPTRHTELGVGDDGALIRPTPGAELVVSTDMLVEGTHFLPGAEAEALGWKTLAVNLSDMAAMGARPRWTTLALALPWPREAWVAAFAKGFFECAAAFDVDVIGGDTTCGPLTLCATIFGEVPAGQAIRRDGAWLEEDVWVSGQPGRAALGLAHLQGRLQLAEAALPAMLAALHRPQPRVALGLALRGIAKSAIDVSDGLLADLGHILERSGVGAVIDTAHLPEAALAEACADPQMLRDALLAGGDDYEILFTAAPAQRAEIAAIGERLQLPLTRIGVITGEAGELLVRERDGALGVPARRGYDHFADTARH